MILRTCYIAGLVGLTLFMTGCARYTAPKGFKIPETVSEKISLKVGLLIPPEVRTYRIDKKHKNAPYSFRFGEALSDGVERMFSSVFTDVTILEMNAPYEGLDAIVTAEIEKADLRLAAVADKEGVSFLVRVKYRAVDPQGQVLWLDTFEGEGVKKAAMLSEVYTECMQRGLENHFSKASKGLLRSEWWESVTTSSGSEDTQTE